KNPPAGRWFCIYWNPTPRCCLHRRARILDSPRSSAPHPIGTSSSNQPNHVAAVHSCPLTSTSLHPLAAATNVSSSEPHPWSATPRTPRNRACRKGSQPSPAAAAHHADKPNLGNLGSIRFTFCVFAKNFSPYYPLHVL